VRNAHPARRKKVRPLHFGALDNQKSQTSQQPPHAAILGTSDKDVLRISISNLAECIRKERRF
jgi:hypothetical protein